MLPVGDAMNCRVAGRSAVLERPSVQQPLPQIIFSACWERRPIKKVSGGDIYLGSSGVYDANGGGTHHTAITLSGGTFHTVNMGPNTGGTLGTNSVLTGGADWAWASTLPATLATSPGPGIVTFAPEATRTITLNNQWSGIGRFNSKWPGDPGHGSGEQLHRQHNRQPGDAGVDRVGRDSQYAENYRRRRSDVGRFGSFLNCSPLVTGQTLTNSSSTAQFNGNLNTASGTVALRYTPGTPSFAVSGGVLSLATNTVFRVNNTVAALAPGNYKLISAGSGGFVSGAGLPPVTVGGGGVASGQYTSLGVSGNELYLIVTNDRPPKIANSVTNTLTPGSAWQMAITNLAALAGWSDPDGDAVSLSSVGPVSANGTNVTKDATYIYYNGALAADDYFQYTITDGKLTASGTVYIKVNVINDNATAVVPSETNHVISLDGAWRFYLERLTTYYSGSPPNITIVDSSQAFQRTDYVEGAGWTNLAVPGNWEMAGFSPATYYVPDTTSGLYRYWFQVPASWQGRVVRLALDGAQDSAEVWLNGQPVTVNEASWGINNYHESGWTGFQVDLTPQVRFGTTNLLAIRVVKKAASVDLDTGDYFILGGIYRPVTLYSVPQTNFADVQVETHLLPNNQAEVDVSTDVTGGDASTPVSMTLNGVETVANAANGKALFSLRL